MEYLKYGNYLKYNEVNYKEKKTCNSGLYFITN